jgi:hypothetical protein
MSGPAAVAFEFSLLGPSGVLDLMMTLQYGGAVTAAAVLGYHAVDRNGRTLSDVGVHSCYGSEHGELVLTPGENTDLLYLRGDRASETAHVVGEVLDLRPLPRRENPITQVVQQDDRGAELPSGGGFHHLTILNPWQSEAVCHVVAVALDSPTSGPQTAVEVVRLTPQPVVVPPSSQVAVAPDPSAYAAIREYFGRAFVTVKTHPAVG